MSEGTIQPAGDPNASPDPSYGGKFVVHSINLGDRTRVFYSDGTSEDVPMGRVAPSASSSVHTTERLIDPNQLAISQGAGSCYRNGCAHRCNCSGFTLPERLKFQSEIGHIGPILLFTRPAALSRQARQSYRRLLRPRE